MELASKRPGLNPAAAPGYFLTKDSRSPPLRNLSQFRVREGIREQIGEGFGQAGVPAFGLGADGVEGHKPRLEERPRHRLQRLVHSLVQLDLVVQRAEDVGDGTLFRERWDVKFEVGNVGASQAVEYGTDVKKLADLLPPFGPLNQPTKEWRKDCFAIGAKKNEILAEI